MNEISTNKALFDKLHKALEKAASDEASHRRMISNEDYDDDAKQKIHKLNNIAVLELKEYMEQFSLLLNIQVSMAFLGKRIGNFNDAAAIVNDSRIQIISKLESQKVPEQLGVIDNIVNCCNELSSIATFLT
jgi:hypothetical protein